MLALPLGVALFQLSPPVAACGACECLDPIEDEEVRDSSLLHPRRSVPVNYQPIFTANDLETAKTAILTNRATDAPVPVEIGTIHADDGIFRITPLENLRAETEYELRLQEQVLDVWTTGAGTQDGKVAPHDPYFDPSEMHGLCEKVYASALHIEGLARNDDDFLVQITIDDQRLYVTGDSYDFAAGLTIGGPVAQGGASCLGRAHLVGARGEDYIASIRLYDGFGQTIELGAHKFQLREVGGELSCGGCSVNVSTPGHDPLGWMVGCMVAGWLTRRRREFDLGTIN